MQTKLCALYSLEMGGSNMLLAALFSYCAAHAQPFDFTYFETSLLPQWLRLFRAGAKPGAYSFLSAN